MNIESKRLSFRSIDSKDANAIFHYRSDAQSNRFQGWIPQNHQEVCDFIEHKISKEFNLIGSWYQMAIVLRESGQLIGDIGLHFLENEELEIGITIAQEHQGKGFATEALKSIIENLFTHWNKQKIKASVDPRNKASIAMLLKLGFSKEAFHAKAFQIRGEWVDDLILFLNKKNWTP